MQHVNKLLRGQASTTTTQTGEQRQETEQDRDLVNQVFQRLTVICTAWKQALNGDHPDQYAKNYKRELLDSLVHSGINDWQMIERGLMTAKSNGNDFLPNPGKFVEWCKLQVEDFGLPSVEEAYREASRELGKHTMVRSWTHPAIYSAACECGTAFLKSETEKKALPAFTKVYERICARVMAGEQFQLPEDVRLEKKPEQPAPKEVAKKHLADLKAILD